MRVYDFKGEHHIHFQDDLRALLESRYEGDANSFTLFSNDADAPYLKILALADRAFLYFAPEQRGHPGYTSRNDGGCVNAGGTTLFFDSGADQPHAVNNDQIVAFDRAVEAAREFLSTGKMPCAIAWDEL